MVINLIITHRPIGQATTHSPQPVHSLIDLNNASFWMLCYGFWIDRARPDAGRRSQCWQDRSENRGLAYRDAPTRPPGCGFRLAQGHVQPCMPPRSFCNQYNVQGQSSATIVTNQSPQMASYGNSLSPCRHMPPIDFTPISNVTSKNVTTMIWMIMPAKNK